MHIASDSGKFFSSFFQNILYFFDALILEILLLIIKMNNFPGDLRNISAKTATLTAARSLLLDFGDLHQDLGIQLHKTASFQPSTDGQVKQSNKVREEALRAYVHALCTNWSQWLDYIEFARIGTVASHHSCWQTALHHSGGPLNMYSVLCIHRGYT